MVVHVCPVANHHCFVSYVSGSSAFAKSGKEQSGLNHKHQKFERSKEGEELGVIRELTVVSNKPSVQLRLSALGFRLTLSFGALLSSLVCAFRSGEYFYENRRRLGTAILCRSRVLGLMSLYFGLIVVPLYWR